MCCQVEGFEGGEHFMEKEFRLKSPANIATGTGLVIVGYMPIKCMSGTICLFYSCLLGLSCCCFSVLFVKFILFRLLPLTN